MKRDSAEKQKRKAQEMLGISDDRADEIFREQPDRKQQKKKELEEEGKLDTDPVEEVEEEAEETEEASNVCPECGDEFDSEQGMKVHKGQKH